MRLFKFIPKKIGVLGNVLFLSELAVAFISSVLAIYFYGFVENESYVGFIFSFLVCVSIISHFCIVPVVQSKNKSKTYALVIFMMGVGYIFYSLINNLYLFIMVAMIVIVFNTLRLATGGLLVEHASHKNNLAKNEGIIYTFINSAWVLGPLIVGLILKVNRDIRVIFLLAAITMIFSTIIFKYSKINYSGKKKKINDNILRNLREFFRNKNRRRIYLISSGVTFWWALIFVYMPLIIVQSLNEYWVGFFLFFAMIPLVSFQYYFGKIASKNGYKKIFKIGFLIPCFAALLGFAFFSNIWFLMIFLGLATIGLAMTEGTSEAYFFDILADGEDQKYYSSYNTAIDVGNLTGELIPALILLLLPMKFIFLFFALVMFSLAVLSSRMIEVVESRRKPRKFK